MNKILILGAKGTLGQSLRSEFSGEKYDVVALDREDADVTDLQQMLEIILRVKPAVIINATAYNNVEKAEIDPEERKKAYALNADAPKYLAEISKKIGATLVHYSSDYVFDGIAKEYDENARPNPLSEYGRSKLAGETAVQNADGNYYLIRLSRLFGEAGKSEASKKSFVDIMYEKKDLPEIKVVNEECSSPTYAPDLARFTRALIEDSAPWGIYHGANSGSCTWYEFALEIFKNIKPDAVVSAISSAEFNNKAKRPVSSILLNTKRPAQRNWAEAVKEYLGRYGS